MTNPYEIDVNIGDIVREEGRDMPSVVTEVKGSLQLSSFIVCEQGDWRLALPGTCDEPLELLGSISIATVADGLFKSLNQLNYQGILDWLEEESAAGPRQVPTLTK